MTAPTITWGFNAGTLLHFLVLLLAIGAGYQAIVGRTSVLEDRFNTVDANVKKLTKQTDRIERYLSSRDAEYWKRTTQNGDGDQ